MTHDDYVMMTSSNCAIIFLHLKCKILPISFEPFQAALAVGITYAQTRLKKKNIFTVSPKRINLCGSGAFSNSC
jgi:hypothetical protein